MSKIYRAHDREADRDADYDRAMGYMIGCAFAVVIGVAGVVILYLVLRL